MKTLVFEPDPLRARAYASRLGRANGNVDVVGSAEQAAQLMQAGLYDRLALRIGQPSGRCRDVITAQQVYQPDCDVVDLQRMPGREMALAAGALRVPVATRNTS